MDELHKNKKSFVSLIRRFHLVGFIVIVVLCLSAAVILLYKVVETASGTNSSAVGTTSTNFDQATIDRIQELKTPDESSDPLTFSQRRISPFNE